MRAPRRGWLLVVPLVIAAGCSSSGSSGGGHPSPGAGSPTSTVKTVDRRAVDAVLTDVLSGLRSVTSVPAGGTVTQAAKALEQAAAEFAGAGRSLTAAGPGVPTTVAAPVIQRVAQLESLFRQAGACLTRQSHATSPDPKPCLPPLRRANRKDGKLAHELISLAVYSSQSPTAFESQLVKALK